ncbi:MAG: hypothetical protein ACQEUT_11320 [Bacillota bacterium]
MSEVKIGFLHETEIEVISRNLEFHGFYKNTEYWRFVFERSKKESESFL